MKEDRRLRVLKKKVLGKLFGTKMEELTRDLRILQFTKYNLDDKKKRRTGWSGHAVHRRKRRGKVLAGCGGEI